MYVDRLCFHCVSVSVYPSVWARYITFESVEKLPFLHGVTS